MLLLNDSSFTLRIARREHKRYNTHIPFDPSAIRAQFPILSRKVNDKPLIYLDNAATTQKPQCVLEAMDTYYQNYNANAHRSMHVLAEEATQAYEDARKATQRFIKAKNVHEIIFTRGTTESINLVARSWGNANLQKDDVLLLSLLEHHSNIVPWQQLAKRTGCRIEWINIHDDGTLDKDDAQKKIASGNVKLLALTCVSNVLGTVTPYEELTKLAHENGATVLLDAAQCAPHVPIDVQKIDCDFLAFSGHKVYGPLGIGALYGKADLLETMPPFLGGGGMIETVTRNGFTPTHAPQKFEAGTQSVAEAVGLHAALDWLEEIEWKAMQHHEKELIAYALKGLQSLDTVTIFGQQDAEKMHGCISFTVDGIHPHDLTDWLGKQGICLRAGHHCAQPLHEVLNVKSTARLSVGVYNTKKEIDACLIFLHQSFSLL